MPEDSPNHRLQVLRRATIAYAGFLLVAGVVLTATGEPSLALVVVMLGAVMGALAAEAARVRIELARYRRAFGELSDGTDRP